MKPWLIKAVSLLQESLTPPKTELNELDWKAAVSPDKKRLTEHLSAFANYPGVGFMVYGVDNSGVPQGVHSGTVETALNQLSNLGRAALEPPLSLDHAVETYEMHRLLFVHIPESPVKPVHLRGRGIEEAFIRCSGTTRTASRQEIGTMMLNSRTPKWEELRASILMSDTALASNLNTAPLFEMIGRPAPPTLEANIAWMAGEKFIIRDAAGGGFITNLGVLSAAHKLSDFPDLSRKAARVIIYDGLNKAKMRREQEGSRGYAIGFQGLLQFVTDNLPQSEIIEKALRVKKSVYPSITLRELIANALIHQDFTISGAGPLIEIFSDRIEISNPGGLLPSKRLDRLIGTQPESRNELLAKTFRRYKICEEQGSGLLKAGFDVELYGLPPIEFTATPSSFKVTLYSPRTFAAMSARERLEACYQHAVLKHFSDSAMTNKSLRERLKMPEKQRSMVSALIQEAIDKGMIKTSDPSNRSRKFAEYIPSWA